MVIYGRSHILQTGKSYRQVRVLGKEKKGRLEKDFWRR